MRRHLLAVESEAETFAPIFAAAAAVGIRVGWLELAEPGPAPASLEDAGAAGAFRAVAAGGGRSVALKTMRGEPVLRDLLREHFRGCALVLVRGGEVSAPRLEAGGPKGWRIAAAGRLFERRTEDLIAELAKPRLWDEGAKEPE